MSSLGTTQKLHRIATPDVDDGWSLDSEAPRRDIDPAAETRRLQTMPRLATPIVEDAGDFPLVELPKPNLGSPLPGLSKRNERDPSATTANLKSQGKPALETAGSDNKTTVDLGPKKKDAVPSSQKTTVDLGPKKKKGQQTSGASIVPSYWSEASLPRPMAELAQGTQPEHEAPAGVRSVARLAEHVVPTFWQEPRAEEIKTEAQENSADFSEADHAFFAEGEALERQKQSVDEFIDEAEQTLTFWQRLWSK